MIFDKRGTGEALMFFTFFVIITIIAAGVFWNVMAFYGKPYDFRTTHAELLAERVEECLRENDVFAPTFGLSVCGMYVPVDENADYILYVNSSVGKEVVFGVRAYMTQCELASKNDEYANCVRGSVMRNGAKLDYLVGVNRVARREL